MSAKTWKRGTIGHGYCAIRVRDRGVLPWTWANRRMDVRAQLVKWLGAEYYANHANQFKVVRCIVAEAR